MRTTMGERQERGTVLASLLAGPARAVEGPVADVPALLDAIGTQEARLGTVKAILATRLAARQDARPHADGRADAEWLSTAEVAAWLAYSDRTIRRYMHDGTWRKGEHWFRQKGSRPRFRRSALEAWRRASDDEAGAGVGLAYGADIPRGRRRRLTSLRNKCTTAHHGASAGAGAAGAARQVSGAGAAKGGAWGGVAGKG